MLIGDYIGTYTGKTMCGFVNGHSYRIKVDKGDYGYTVYGVKDFTDDDDSSACINYASEKSARSKWDLEVNNEGL